MRPSQAPSEDREITGVEGYPPDGADSRIWQIKPASLGYFILYIV